jgi:hypothetical protein
MAWAVLWAVAHDAISMWDWFIQNEQMVVAYCVRLHVPRRNDVDDLLALSQVPKQQQQCIRNDNISIRKDEHVPRKFVG